MSVEEELVNELESYFLCQHRAYLESIGREIKRAKRDDLKDVQGNWYKYCVDGKLFELSAKRYRVTNHKEPRVKTSTSEGGTPSGPTTEHTSETPAAMTDRLHQEQIIREGLKAEEGTFSRFIDWGANKLKNNRGLLGMVAGVGLTFAGQTLADRYQKTRDSMAAPAMQGGDGNQGNNTSGN